MRFLRGLPTGYLGLLTVPFFRTPGVAVTFTDSHLGADARLEAAEEAKIGGSGRGSSILSHSSTCG